MRESGLWIPMSDGVRLSASRWQPDTDDPAPVLLEANPYRKDDLTRTYANEYVRFVAEGGYAVVRIDLRGTGSSEGLAVDEYPEQEQDDLCEAIAWIAAQPWCDGGVGMFGTSYSGFNSIQVAVRRPPALKAIVPIYATDDRYHDDVHYWGGARRAMDFVDYPSYMVAMNALPPSPSLVGDAWRAQWQARVEALQPWMLRWLEEQTDGPYWRHGSLAPDYSRLVCPAMIVAGWADGYRNNSFRTFERLNGPKRLVFGPWAHSSTATSLPGPRVDLVPEMLRWFDRWVRGREDTGLEDEPPIVVYVRRSTAPQPDLDEMRGEWRFEPVWPPAHASELVLELGEGRAAHGHELVVRGDVGITGSISCAGGLPWGQPWDQRPDEALSLTYDWGPFDEDVEVLGTPRLEVTVTSSAPVAFLAAKLCDVFPDGTSALACRGFLNLTHRDSHTDPAPLSPGRAYAVAFDMDVTSWVFERGHRMRLDLAGADWPNVWPPPAPLTLTVAPGASRVRLPVMAGPSPAADVPSFPPPPPEDEARGPTDLELPVTWREERDVLGRQTRVVVGHGNDSVTDTGARVSERYSGATGVSTVDPGRAWSTGHAEFTLEWPEATVTSEVTTRLESDASTWHLTIDLDVREGDESRWSRRWERRFPRALA